MIDTIKDYIFSKRFSILAYVCVIIHFHCGVLLTAITTAVRLGETEKFSCRVDTDIATRKIDVEKTCFSLYDDTYNSPVRFHVFAVLNFGSVVLVSVIYSLAVGNSIDETERYVAGRDQFQTAGKKRGDEPGGTTFYVFYFYFIHLVARLMLGILFTILQHSVSYPSGFDSQFSCVYPDIKQAEHNITAVQNASINTESSHVTCTNSAAQDKQFWVAFVSVCNVIFAIITLAELIYLIRNQFLCFNTQSNVAWSCDSQFITEFFLRKQYMFIPFEDDTFTGVDNCTLSSIDIYKQKVLKDPLIDINYGPNVSLNDMFIDVVIQTEQAPHKFLKGMSRHEIYDVCMEVPKHSIRLKERKDLFYPNKDTEGIFPHTILTLGRLGIGKTVLTRKILHDWANDVDYFYQDKITFLFKLRCFNFPEFQSLTLKKFLQFGTELNEDQFESIFEQIIHNSHKLILIFDGLDELCSNSKEFEDYIYRSKTYSNNPDIPMSALFLFIKIIFGDLIENATVLVTSRPTASDVYSKLNNKFDRRVEIIGFTADKIEKYVEQFCVNHQHENLKPKIWNHINSSSEIKNLCYIPVNSFIVCVTLSKCLTDPVNDSPLPTTLTELYQAALVYFHENHDCYEKVIKELQFLAFKDNVKAPPELNRHLPPLKDIGSERYQWSSEAIKSQLPTDILLVTTTDHEFRSCYSYMKQVRRSCCPNGLMVDFGEFGDQHVKVALIRFQMDPLSALTAVNNATEYLNPKVVLCVGICATVNREKAKLGDVIISAKLVTYASKKITSDGKTEHRGIKTNVSRRMASLIPSAADGWEPPLKEPSSLDVRIHREAVMLSGPELVDNDERRQELLDAFPDAIGLEMEGEGLYAVAYDLGIEWAVIKGVSDYADGSKKATEDWQSFASTMAASVVYHMFQYADVLKQWRHYDKPGATKDHKTSCFCWKN